MGEFAPMRSWNAKLVAAAMGLAAAAGVALTIGGSTTACAPVIPPPPPDPCNVQVVTLNLYAADLINPNEEDLPRPVIVRLYQLGSDLRMLNAKYDDILLKDAEVLKDDILKVDEIEVFPNDLVEIKFERIPEAVLLAGVALFHSPRGQSWKTYYEFPPMPNAPEACSKAAGALDAGAPQAFPQTEFFLSERKIDNGEQFDPSMFPSATPIRKISLPKASAGADSVATTTTPASK